MSGAGVSCARCRTPLSLAEANTGRWLPCPGCRRDTRLEIFPALFNPAPSGSAPAAIVLEGEASCFFHPPNRAVVSCHNCGRFLCALCDLDLEGRHLCPSCLETGRQREAFGELVNRRVLYDSAALSLAVVPLLIWPFTLATAPAAIVVALYGWNKPSSLVPRTRLRALLAIGLGLVELGGWGLLFYALSTAT
jgi:hypothetical protein